MGADPSMMTPEPSAETPLQGQNVHIFYKTGSEIIMTTKKDIEGCVQLAYMDKK